MGKYKESNKKKKKFQKKFDELKKKLDPVTPTLPCFWWNNQEWLGIASSAPVATPCGLDVCTLCGTPEEPADPDDVLPGIDGGCRQKLNAVVSFCTCVDSKAVCEDAGHEWSVVCCNS